MKPIARQFFLTASVAINIVAHGCVIGFSAILIPSLRRPESHIQVTPSQESWIASIVGFALIVGNIIVTPLMDTLGRKKSHILTIIPVLVGWFLLTTANNVASLISARFLQGVSMGMLGPLGSIIIGEMTDPRNRGAFLTCVSLALTTGVLSTHALGTYFSWQQNALICSFITFTSLIMIIYNPESPPWLIAKQRFEKAEDIFYYLRGKDNEQQREWNNMLMAQRMIAKFGDTEQKSGACNRIKTLFRYLRVTSTKPEFYKPIIIMFLLYTMFQFAGINVISSYTMDIIHKVVGPEANSKFLMVALDVERLVCNLLAVYLMRSMKRRTLLFSSGGGCVLAYIGKSLYVYAKQMDALPYDSQWIPIALIAIYMFSLTVGVSSIPFTLSGEIFPLEYRGLGGGISVLALSLNFFIAVKCFPVLNYSIGLPLTYLLYASVVTICLSIIYFMLPETKDRTLQDIENTFRGLPPSDLKSTQPLKGCSFHDIRRGSSVTLY